MAANTVNTVVIGSQSEECLSLRVFYRPAPRPVDWHRFLSGVPCGFAEIGSGAVVERRLATRSGRIIQGMEAIPWSRSHGARILFLAGEAGEGKTSFLRRLMWHSADAHLVIEASYTTIAGNASAQAFRDVIQDFMPSGDGRSSVLLVLDVSAPPTTGQETALAEFLAEVSNAWDEGAEMTAIVAGRPPWMHSLRRRTQAASEVVRLAPLDVNELASLHRMIHRAYTDLLRVLDDEELGARYPNLRHSGSLSAQAPLDPDCASPSVLVTFLKAVYGEHFHFRLVEECKAMTPADQAAYVQVCLATVAAGKIPEQLLSRLCGQADLDTRSQFDPWTRDADSNHMARHAVIAQTVIEESGLHTRIRTALQDLLQHSVPSAEMSRLFLRVLESIGLWEPVAVGERTRLSPNQIRKMAREVLLEGSGELFRVVLGKCVAADELIYCSRILTMLLPESPGASEETLNILDLTSRALRMAHALPDKASLTAEPVAYYLDKTEYLRSKISGDAPASSLTLVHRWKEFVGREWCRADFYADLIGHCIKARSQMSEYDENETLEVYLTAEAAYQHLRSCGKISSGFLGRYMKFRVRSIYNDLPPDLRKIVFERGWQLSLRLKRTDGGVGIQLDQELASVGRETRDDRIDLLLSIVRDADYSQHFAAIRLASLVRRDTQTRQVALNAMQAIRRDNLSDISSAMLSHGVAILLAPDDPRHVEELRKACGDYKEGIFNRDGWLDWNEYWKQAARQLSRFDSDAGQEALKEWQSHRARFDGRATGGARGRR